MTPRSGPLAQVVEHLTFNQRVAGSSPARLTRLHVTILIATALLAAAAATPAATPPRPKPDSLAITDVTVVDVVGGARRRVTVVISGERIVSVGQGIAIPKSAKRLDGAGRFLIPGLWDMHVHHQATGVESLDLYLAQGVVGTRDMGSDLDFILPLRDRIRRGELRGPEIVAAGPILDAAPADWPFRRRVTNAQEAREAVRDLKSRGVDFIKVHDRTPRDAFFAIADEAAKLGLPFAGHVPAAVTVEEAAESGMASIEHLANNRVFLECSGGQPYSEAGCRPLFDRLAAKKVWQTPTSAFFLTLPDVFTGQPLPHEEYASDPLLDLTRRNIAASKLDERALSFLRSSAAASLSAIHDLHARDNGLLAGCDGLVPGFCLHDELERLTEAGLSPLESIQTATINPAIFLGRAKTQGTVETGKRADLVLLEADPLADIHNTRRIAAVVVRGRLLPKEEIARMLAARRRARPAAPAR